MTIDFSQKCKPLKMHNICGLIPKSKIPNTSMLVVEIQCNIFIMRVYRRRRWDVTHSLTPKLSFNDDQEFKLRIPEIPELKKPAFFPKNASNLNRNRSRKHRMIEERNTEIEKANLMLYGKIRKIMQKGHTSDKKLEMENASETDINSQFMSTSKPLSLPQMPNFNTTKSQLSTILSNRPKFAQKYFEELAEARANLANMHTEEIAKLVCFGWKVTVMKFNHGQFLVLSGRKGKREIQKKYIYERVKGKVDEQGLENWASSKFEFQL